MTPLPPRKSWRNAFGQNACSAVRAWWECGKRCCEILIGVTAPMMIAP